MAHFITIAIFQYPQNAYVIKSKLQSEGIDVLLKDELTVQNHNFLSNAIGGIKLQVKEADLEPAISILKAAGIPIYEPSEGNDKIWDYLDRKTLKIPLLNKWPVEVRSLFVIAIILFPLIIFVYYAALPGKEDLSFEEKLRFEAREAKRMLDQVYIPTLDTLSVSDPELAMRYINRLLVDYPRNKDLRVNLGVAFYHIDSFEQAIQQFELAKQYSDSDWEKVENLSNIALTQLAMKDYDGAIKTYLQASESYSQYYIEVAKVYEETHDKQNALKYYNLYLEKNLNEYPAVKYTREFMKIELKALELKRELEKG